MSSTSNTSKAEVSNIVSSDQEYEVFLSFRGPDTRAGFTDHLYRRLIDANVRAYRDDEELRKGEKIGPELLRAINRSAIAIPIFSKRYAESKWCLNELVEILKCKRSSEMKVIPIFYYIKPSDVRNHIGDYEKAFALHEQKYGSTITREWKEAMSEIGNLSGWEIPSDTYSREGELVEDVTKEMSFALKKAYVKIPDHLVGLSYHVGKILELLSLETQGVRIIGIHGMGGIGKTTLAKVVYNHLLTKFEGSSFLADTRSKDIEDLKKNMTSDILARKSSNYVDKGTSAKRFIDKRVLVVIDDVDEKMRLEDLIGKRDKHLFASRSRIIITSRNKGFLGRIQVDESYELTGMNHVHSLQLFCRHAFESGKPKDDYVTFSKQIVETTGGLPLALEVIGSSLHNESKEEWKSKLERLKDVAADDVLQKLRISYDELNDRQKHIFLDIACFFIGQNQRDIIHFWDPQNFFPKEAISVLQQKSLIKVHDNKLWMHDQLRDLGREIVREGNIMNLEKQTRLWNLEEGTKVFMTNKMAKNLKVLDLSWCQKLVKTPDFSSHLQLERLILQCCSALVEIDKSIGMLKLLVHLDLTYCGSLCKLPKELHCMESLTELLMDGCHDIVKIPRLSNMVNLEVFSACHCTSLIPDSIGELVHLVKLNLINCCSLKNLPESIGGLVSLTHLEISESEIEELPNSIGELVHLVELDLIRCSSLKKHPESIGGLVSLTHLDISESEIEELPNSIGELVHLVMLGLDGCSSLKKLPESIGGLVSLTYLHISESGIEKLPNSIVCLKNLMVLSMSHTPIRELPSTIGMVKKLEEIDARGCRSLCGGLPMLPESLINLTLPFEIMDAVPILSNLINLVNFEIDLKEWAPIESPSPWWMGRLSKVENLDLAFPWMTTLHPNIGALSQLTRLQLVGCVHLQSIPKLPPNLTSLQFDHCCMISQVDELPENLDMLRISNCGNLKRLPQMSQYKKLERLDLWGCPNLVEIHGRLESIETLWIWSCKSLVKIPDILNVKTLRVLRILGCPELIQEGSMSRYEPVLMDNPPISKKERSFMSNMLRICGYSQNEEEKVKGKRKREWVET